MLGHGGLVALGKPVAASPALLDVRGVDGQDVAFPLAGRKSHEGMHGVIGRMRTAIHPDGARLFVGADVILDGDYLLGIGVLFFPDPEMQRAMIDVRRNVHAALVFLQREARCVPALGEGPRGIVDGKTGEIAQIGPRNALVIILVMQRAPLAGELVLTPQWERWLSRATARRPQFINMTCDSYNSFGAYNNPACNVVDETLVAVYSDHTASSLPLGSMK